MAGWRVDARSGWTVCVAIWMIVGQAGAAGQTAQQAKPIAAGEVPQRKKVAALAPRGTYVPVKTPWGDPDITGDYNNSDESGIPFERPDEFAGRALADVSLQELAKLVEQRQQQTIECTPTLSEFPGATSPMHWFENYYAANSRAWLVSEPADGKVPPQTDEARARAAARAATRKGRGPADSWEDRSLYDRCITRGIPGSMMPAIYGNSYQHPAVARVRHDHLRDGPRHARDSDRSPDRISGRASGSTWETRAVTGRATRWCVETTNFTDKTPYRGSSDQLRMVERFTPLGPDTVEWSVTFDDPHTWARPWTFAMNLTQDASQPPFEYACHEGNYGLRNILAAARAEEAAAQKSGTGAGR